MCLCACAAEPEACHKALESNQDGGQSRQRVVTTVTIPAPQSSPATPATPTSPLKAREPQQPAQPEPSAPSSSEPALGHTVQPFVVGNHQQQPRSVAQSLASFDRLLTRVKSTVEIIRSVVVHVQGVPRR